MDSAPGQDFANYTLARLQFAQEQCYMDHSFESGPSSDEGGLALHSVPLHYHQKCMVMQKCQLYQASFASFYGIYLLEIARH